jgi:hypothetical protein
MKTEVRPQTSALPSSIGSASWRHEQTRRRPSETPAIPPARGVARSVVRWIAGLIVLASAAVWDEVFFAAPAVALSAQLGLWPALATLVPAYWLLGSSLSLLVVRAPKSGGGGRFETMVANMAAKTEGGRIRRALVAGSLVGFVLASWILGGILTSWVLGAGGMRHRLSQWVIAANAIWAVTFVGQYAGIGELIW